MFITLEGPEGSGKTSHVPALVEYLRDKGYRVFATREPGGTPIGEQIRQVIHDMKNVEMDARTETLLYQAARWRHPLSGGGQGGSRSPGWTWAQSVSDRTPGEVQETTYVGL